MTEHIPASYLAFTKEQILSHQVLLAQHQKIYEALRRLIVSGSNPHFVSTINSCLIKIMTMFNNASALNDSLLSALTAFVDAAKRFKKASKNR